MRKSSKTTKSNGFTLPEILTYIGVATILYVVVYNPLTQALASQTRDTKRDCVLLRIQHAKNQYDLEANTADKKRFNRAPDNERYNFLAPILKEPDPVNLVNGTGINKLIIGELGSSVKAE